MPRFVVPGDFLPPRQRAAGRLPRPDPDPAREDKRSLFPSALQGRERQGRPGPGPAPPHPARQSAGPRARVRAHPKAAALQLVACRGTVAGCGRTLRWERPFLQKGGSLGWVRFELTCFFQ